MLIALLAVLGVSHPAPAGKVRRLGDDPMLVTLAAGGNRIEIAVPAEDLARVLAPFTRATPDGSSY